jgi:F-type H+-transporting ATPase subunit alpha
LRRFEEDIFKFIEGSHPAVLSTIRDKKTIDDDLKAAMREAIEDFKSTRWNSNAGQNGGAIVVESPAATAANA